jgi:hypothetical protein
VAADGLAELDGVLGLEVAAREVVGSGEGYEREPPLFPERIEAVLQGRM